MGLVDRWSTFHGGGEEILLSSRFKFPFTSFPGGSDGKASACHAGDPGWEDPLEKEMAIHSSTLAWKIPWTEEPGRLQSHGVAESDTLSDLTFTFFHLNLKRNLMGFTHCIK